MAQGTGDRGVTIEHGGRVASDGADVARLIIRVVARELQSGAELPARGRSNSLKVDESRAGRELSADVVIFDLKPPRRVAAFRTNQDMCQDQAKDRHHSA